MNAHIYVTDCNYRINRVLTLSQGKINIVNMLFRTYLNN